MTPFFTPNPNDIAEYGVPKIFLAGVGELMTEVAGEVCDGFICHGFTTEKYLREVTLPALVRGRAKAGKTMEGFEVVGPSFVVTGNNDEELEAASIGTRQQIAFYGSTPAYRGVLDIHGWGGLQDELNTLSKAGKWVEMGNVINEVSPKPLPANLVADTATSFSALVSTRHTRATQNAGAKLLPT